MKYNLLRFYLLKILGVLRILLLDCKQHIRCTRTHQRLMLRNVLDRVGQSINSFRHIFLPYPSLFHLGRHEFNMIHSIMQIAIKIVKAVRLIYFFCVLRVRCGAIFIVIIIFYFCLVFNMLSLFFLSLFLLSHFPAVSNKLNRNLLEGWLLWP